MLPIASHRFFEGGALPDAYEASGMRVALRTDFRAWLKYDYLRENHDGMADEELVYVMHRLCCRDMALVSSAAAPHVEFMFQAFNWFHSCADSERIARIKVTGLMRDTMNKQPRLSCLFWDFKSVWESFKQQYDIDLYAVETIHWWEFLRLMKGLKADTPYEMQKYMRSMQRYEVVGTESREMKMKETQDKISKWNLISYQQVLFALPEKW
jgi:sarcosine oxidase delta subunit